MDFTKQMLAVIQTIWHLRTSTKKKKLIHTDVEKHSRNFTDDKKPVSRQIWYSRKSRTEWQDIKRAIEGKLPSDHPVEQMIATFAEGDTTGMFAAEISKMANENGALKTELEAERKTFKEFVERSRQEQYAESRFRVNFEALTVRVENLQKEKQKDVKTIQNYQADNLRLREENNEFRKKVAVRGTVKNPNFYLFQPDLKKISIESTDKELMGSYQEETVWAFGKMKAAMKKKTPEDIFFVFHSFNIDLKQFVLEELPFKFSDNNYVFGCCDLSGTSRKNFFGEAARELDLIKPTVVLVCGRGRPSDADKPSNVIEMPSAKSIQDIQGRLRTLIIDRHKRVDYDVVYEDYDTVLIKRI